MNHPTFHNEPVPARFVASVRPATQAHLWFRIQALYGPTVTDPRAVLKVTGW